MDGSNNNNAFANMFAQGFPAGFNLSDFQQLAPAPAMTTNNMNNAPADASAPAPTGTNNFASALTNNDASFNPMNGTNMNNFGSMNNFAPAGLNNTGMMNALQQQQPQNQQLQPQMQQQPQQQAALMNAFSNMPGMAGMMYPFAAGMQAQQMGVQAGGAFPQNMGGMFNPNMANAMGMGMMGMNMQGLQNFMSPAAAAPQAPVAAAATGGADGTNNNESDELRQKLSQVQAPVQAPIQAPVHAPVQAPAQAQSNPQQAFAPLFQNSGTAQGFNPMMMMFGGAAMGQNPLAAAQMSAFGVNPLAFQNASSMLAQGANTHTNGTPNPVNSNSNSNSATTSTSGVVPPSSISLTAPASLFSAQANSLAALGALDASGLITSSEDLKNATAKGKKSKKKVKGKPKRPLSAYNLFSKDERERILKSIPGSEKKNKKKSKGEKDKSEDSAVKNKEDTDSKDKSNEQDYDQMDKNGKKIPHGKIGFENLAKLIGKRWQELEPEHVEKYKKLADKDMKRYKEEMEVFLTREARAGLEDDSLGAPLFYNTKDDSEDEKTDRKRKLLGASEGEKKKKVSSDSE